MADISLDCESVDVSSGGAVVAIDANGGAGSHGSKSMTRTSCSSTLVLYFSTVESGAAKAIWNFASLKTFCGFLWWIAYTTSPHLNDTAFFDGY
ncbi:hypothetical protein [Agrobacterium fabrum]|uniref:hypothetical protein n=1 Tax=Agrobacterium fabrum TaxID=1176649 RepID=UPI001644D967|nr:hypothetical protein [Agrobacterium fabrum]